MKNYAILISILLALSSCEGTETETWSVSLKKRIVNPTDKVLYYEVVTDEGTQNAIIYPNDSIEFLFYREKEVEKEIFDIGFTVRQNKIEVERDILFALSDTCKYINIVKYTGYTIPKGDTEKEQLFLSCLNGNIEAESTDKNVKLIITLLVIDSLFDIMEKDYSMLEQFPEYYGK